MYGNNQGISRPKQAKAGQRGGINPVKFTDNVFVRGMSPRWRVTYPGNKQQECSIIT